MKKVILWMNEWIVEIVLGAFFLTALIPCTGFGYRDLVGEKNPWIYYPAGFLSFAVIMTILFGIIMGIMKGWKLLVKWAEGG